MLQVTLYDPGVIPGVDFAEHFFDERIAPWLIMNQGKRDELKPKCKQNAEFQDTEIEEQCPEDRKEPLTKRTIHHTNLYRFLTEPHPSRCSFEFEDHENIFNARFCVSCQLFKPLRSSHSSKSNACIERYDHYCVWIGHDVGLLNHWLFYRMLLFIMLYIFACFIFGVIQFVESILIVFKCEASNKYYCNEKPSSVLLWLSLAAALVLLSLFCYFCFSMWQLIAFHFKMLNTGNLTKEDLGRNAQNFNFTALYNKFSRKGNFLSIKMNHLENESYIRIITQYFEKLEKYAKDGMSISSMEQLIEKDVELNDINIFKQVLGLTEIQSESYDELSSETSDRYAQIFEIGWDEKETQKMLRLGEILPFNKCVTPYLAALKAIQQSRAQIVNSPEDVEKFKKDHPEVLLEKSPNNLLLAGCGKQKPNNAALHPVAQNDELRRRDMQKQMQMKEAKTEIIDEEDVEQVDLGAQFEEI